MDNLEKYMDIAFEEAKQSLKEGNCGFGAVIVKNKRIIAHAHDTEKTANDPTVHAEINAIKIAASKIGKNLVDCLLIATHEPCPMCSTAAVWSKINQIGYGYSIKEAIMQGRKRIDIGCKEIFKRAGLKVTIHEGNRGRCKSVCKRSGKPGAVIYILKLMHAHHLYRLLE